VPEAAVVAGGVATAVLFRWVSTHQLPVAFPPLTVVPTVSGLSLLAVLVGLAGALCSPPPVLPTPAPALPTASSPALRKEVSA
jgi:energy-coupling factor transport system permease protein